MGQQLLSSCQVETRRLIWLTGMMFAVIVVFRYYELSNCNFLSPLYSSGKASEVGNSSFQTGNSPPKSDVIGNKSIGIGSDSPNTYVIHKGVNSTGTSNGRVRDPEDVPLSERNGGSKNSQGLDEDINTDKESTSEDVVQLANNSVPANFKSVDNAFDSEARKTEQRLEQKNDTTASNFSIAKFKKDDNTSSFEHMENSGPDFASPLSVFPPMNLSSNAASPPVVDRTTTSDSKENSGKLQNDLPQSGKNSTLDRVPEVNKGFQMPASSVVTISEMNSLLLQSRASYHSVTPGWSSAVDQELLNAKLLVENASIVKYDPDLYAPLYRNGSMFKRSYKLMEDTLKVYIYKEGEKPVLHQPYLSGIYASEGWFMKLLEANKKFTTRNPRKAHLFYLPFSSRMLEETHYVANSHSFDNLIQFLKNYLDQIAVKHPFWNRTGGADHFLVACHDWAPVETNQHMAKCIRALCNADVKEGFVLGKDVSLPETYVQSPQNPLRDLGGKPPSQRSILAFFAGNLHGYVRPILLQHWENKDPDMKIFGRMRKSKHNKNYLKHMKNSKYCICAKGYEVNSPRVVEAIFHECVPVIISDNFVPPFFEVLNWESFAVFVLEKDIPNLKSILLSIPEQRYLEMQMRVKKVQKHFLWHAKPVKYDIFHMILHSVWYNRLYQASPR